MQASQASKPSVVEGEPANLRELRHEVRHVRLELLVERGGELEGKMMRSRARREVLFMMA